jgi:hypothetical protein
MRNYQSLYIPGLLQTDEYARAAIHGTAPTATAEEVENRVRARLERQERLAGDSPVELWAIMDEAAIRRLVGGSKVMRAQLTHLLDSVKLPNVTLQVIPYDVGAHPGMPGSFVYMVFTDAADPDLVYVDTQAGDLFLEADDDLRLYSSMFDHLRAIALSPSKLTARKGTTRRPSPSCVRSVQRVRVNARRDLNDGPQPGQADRPTGTGARVPLTLSFDPHDT